MWDQATISEPFIFYSVPLLISQFMHFQSIRRENNCVSKVGFKRDVWIVGSDISVWSQETQEENSCHGNWWFEEWVTCWWAKTVRVSVRFWLKDKHRQVYILLQIGRKLNSTAGIWLLLNLSSSNIFFVFQGWRLFCNFLKSLYFEIFSPICHYSNVQESQRPRIPVQECLRSISLHLERLCLLVWCLLCACWFEVWPVAVLKAGPHMWHIQHEGQAVKPR